MTTSSPIAVRVVRWDLSVSRPTLWALVVLAALLVGLIVASRISFGLFNAVGAAILAVLAYLSYRAPRGVLIAIVIVPILDRYLVSLAIPESLHERTNFLSEALLLLVATVIAIRALRDGTAWAALRHPVVVLLAAFAFLGLLSAAINGVPPLVAGVGLLFTLDAAVLFVLPRLTGFTERQALVPVVAFVTIATVAGVLALCQVFLHPDFLGLESFTGRFSEGNRIAAFLVNPNMLGVILAMAIPFPLLAAVRAGERRHRTLALGVTFILVLGLLYSFSRGAWLGLGVAMLVVGILLERRALLILLVMGAIAYGSASILPRHILLEENGGSTGGFDLGGATLGRLDSLDEGDLRVLFIQNAAPIVADHPLVGAGPGRYGGAVARAFGSPLYDRYTAGSVPEGRTVDNFWLHLLVEFGILGTLLFAGALVLAIREVLAAGRQASGMTRGLLGGFAAVAIILFVDSLVEMLLEGNTTSFALWSFLGIGSMLAARVRAGDERGGPPHAPSGG